MGLNIQELKDKSNLTPTKTTKVSAEVPDFMLEAMKKNSIDPAILIQEAFKEVCLQLDKTNLFVAHRITEVIKKREVGEFNNTTETKNRANNWRPQTIKAFRDSGKSALSAAEVAIMLDEKPCTMHKRFAAALDEGIIELQRKKEGKNGALYSLVGHKKQCF